MDWDAIAAVGEAIGASGVLLTLVYLSIQVRHYSRVTGATAMHSLLESHRAWTRLFISNAEAEKFYIRALHDDESLSHDEFRRFTVGHVVDLALQAQATMEYRDRGLIPEADYDKWIGFVASVLRTPGGARAWKEAQGWLTPSVVSVLNDRIQEDRDEPCFVESSGVVVP